MVFRRIIYKYEFDMNKEYRWLCFSIKDNSELIMKKFMNMKLVGNSWTSSCTGLTLITVRKSPQKQWALTTWSIFNNERKIVKRVKINTLFILWNKKVSFWSRIYFMLLMHRDELHLFFVLFLYGNKGIYCPQCDSR